ncbi:hypothetical protein pmac_cds_496 [Pandoravirus macleodensis]|uniref:Uncharacterized protein n=1 Tax=Pandoravirus macleodensis TaxID=2107707 RepID=A0A2U7UFG2_9VIRU|nr:hypothetical protein pmac_cds_496 [Pandoravirus macleodensis]AVK77184.1 hypothetical protein pmac_cds_496 [Pandoravirus macleodensis]UMO79902.1 hypothetical protein [Pandoravirus aubagnensis]
MAGLGAVIIVGISGACGMAAGLCAGGTAVLLGPRVACLVSYTISVPTVLVGLPGAGMLAAFRAMPRAFRRPSAVDGSLWDACLVAGATGGYGLGCLAALAVPPTWDIASRLIRPATETTDN